MHLLPAYAFATGCRIDRMLLEPHYYPLGFSDPYVLIVTGTGMEGKTYPYWRIVVDALREPLRQNGIKLVQCGGEKEERVGADLDLCGQTTTAQYFDVISKAALVLCGDTSAVHIAGHYDRKLCSLFSVSDVKVSGAYFGTKSNQIYLTPPAPWVPSYNPNENPKTIANILPETVVKAVGALLDIKVNSFETVYIGSEANVTIIESVPDMVVRPDYYPDQSIGIRFDKGGEEKFVYEQLSVRKSSIVTNKPLNIDILQSLRGNLETIIYLVEEFNDDPSFPKELQEQAIPYILLSTLPRSVLAPKLLNYCDLNLLNNKEIIKKSDLKLLNQINENTKFKSQKKIISSGKAYLSFAHLRAGKFLVDPLLDVDNVINTPEFWEDCNFYYLYNV